MALSRQSLLEWCLLLVVVAFYLPTLAEIGHAWSTHRYGAHGIFVPLLSAVILWARRDELSQRQGPRCPLGLLLLGAGLGLAGVGHATQSVTSHVVSVVLTVSGIALWIRGSAWMRPATAPLAFLLFMLPLPREAAGAVTLPLQHFAANFAAGALELVNIPVVQEGVLLQLGYVQLQVNEGCNGLRFLMVLLVVTTAFALIHLPTWRLRLTVTTAAVAMGLVANALRVTSIAAATHVIGPHAPIGTLHNFAGRIIWVMTIMSIIGFGVVLSLKAKRPGPAEPLEAGARRGKAPAAR